MPKYAKTAYVDLPSGNGAQAVVMDVTETVPGFPVYTLSWLTPQGEPLNGTVGEGDLEDAQPEIITLVEAEPALKFVVPKPAATIFKNKRKPAPKRKR